MISIDQVTAPSWNGTFTLNMQSNARRALEEARELENFMDAPGYLDAPAVVRGAVLVAWAKAKEELALHRDCIATFCEPWFDRSAFLTPEQQRGEDL